LAEPGRTVETPRVQLADLGQKVGWYTVSGGDTALVTWSEAGELVLMRPKYDNQRVRLVPRTPHLFDVIDAEGNFDGTLAFGVHQSGEGRSFHWLHESTLSTIGERDWGGMKSIASIRPVAVPSFSLPVY
jgi:hypothetical protein